jgi:hypothetical protein
MDSRLEFARIWRHRHAPSPHHREKTNASLERPCYARCDTAVRTHWRRAGAGARRRGRRCARAFDDGHVGRCGNLGDSKRRRPSTLTRARWLGLAPLSPPPAHPRMLAVWIVLPAAFFARTVEAANATRAYFGTQTASHLTVEHSTVTIFFSSTVFRRGWHSHCGGASSRQARQPSHPSHCAQASARLQNRSQSGRCVRQMLDSLQRYATSVFFRTSGTGTHLWQTGPQASLHACRATRPSPAPSAVVPNSGAAVSSSQIHTWGQRNIFSSL